MRRFVMAMAVLGLIAATPAGPGGADIGHASCRGKSCWLRGGADPLFDFSFSGGGISGSGTLDATDNGDGTFTAFSGSGTVIGAPNGESLLTLYPSASPPGEVLSPSGYFIYDSQLLPAQDPRLTNGGLLFFSSGYEVNIFSNGPGSYTYYDNSGFNTPVSFSVWQAVTPAGVPEPPTLILAGIGSLIGLVFAWYRRRAAMAL